MVAEAFIPNPHKYKEVNHINSDKTDARVENLERVTPSQNILHSRKS
ncbi:MAG: HNH endonuclease [Methanobrevibacter sp.]|nr:HNH endonuclease [Methanobrevibacter sp.]